LCLVDNKVIDAVDLIGLWDGYGGLKLACTPTGGDDSSHGIR
jgi:hypothetical protein